MNTVMQTALQKIGKHFENMLSTSEGRSPPDPPSPSHKIVYIINDVNVVEKNRQAVTEVVWQCLKPIRPLNERQTLW